jgi:hypothetical protein
MGTTPPVGATPSKMLPTPDYLLTPGMQQILGGGQQGADADAAGFRCPPSADSVGGGAAAGYGPGEDATVVLLPASELLRGAYPGAAAARQQEADGQLAEERSTVGVDDVEVEVEAEERPAAGAEDEPPAAETACADEADEEPPAETAEAVEAPPLEQHQAAEQPAQESEADAAASQDDACRLLEPEQGGGSDGEDASVCRAPLEAAGSIGPGESLPSSPQTSAAALPPLQASESPVASSSPAAETDDGGDGGDDGLAPLNGDAAGCGRAASPVPLEATDSGSLLSEAAAGSPGSEADDATGGLLVTAPGSPPPVSQPSAVHPAPKLSLSPALESLRKRHRALLATPVGRAAHDRAAPAAAAAAAATGARPTPTRGVRESIPLFVLHPGTLGGAMAAGGPQEQLLVGGDSADDDDDFLSSAPAAESELSLAVGEALSGSALQLRHSRMLGAGPRRVAPAGSGTPAFVNSLAPVAELSFSSPASSQG